MNVLKALIQNCKMANATSNSTSVVLTENDIPGLGCLERRKLAKFKRRSLSSLDLVVWGAIMNTVYRYGESHIALDKFIPVLTTLCMVGVELLELSVHSYNHI